MLDLSKLEKARRLAGGIVQARCPACAEAGRDRAGEHLRIFPDGRFGCCVAAGEKEHRRRIFALTGIKTPRSLMLRQPASPPCGEACSIKACLIEFGGKRE